MRGGLWKRIKTIALTDVSVLVKGIPQEVLEDFERLLIEADFGPVAFDTIEELEATIRRGELKSEGALRQWLTDRIATAASDGASPAPLNLGENGAPGVIVLFGVNGVGKTTQAAKLAHRFRGENKTVLLAAADTFRAGATEQLQLWADRLGVPFVGGTAGGDPAAVAYDAVEAAMARGIDVVIIDTAGRLHTQGDLVGELQKIVRVVGRRCPGAPHESLLVLDGTVGQNALQQGRVFADAVPLSGLIVTKLDGTAKGGAVINLRRELGVPVRFVGVGERVEDLDEFDPQRYAEQLLGE